MTEEKDEQLRSCADIVSACDAGLLRGRWLHSRKQDSAKATVAIHAGRLIDVRTGRVTTNAYIMIAKDRIVGIADSAPAEIFQTIDLSKYTVVPGLIDCHAHRVGKSEGSILCLGLADVIAAEGDLGGAQPADLA